MSSSNDATTISRGMVTCFDDLSAVLGNFADDLSSRSAELRQVAENMNALCAQAQRVQDQA